MIRVILDRLARWQARSLWQIDKGSRHTTSDGGSRFKVGSCEEKSQGHRVWRAEADERRGAQGRRFLNQIRLNVCVLAFNTDTATFCTTIDLCKTLNTKFLER